MRQYKVGDIVQIRQWEDMAKEFSVTDYGNIMCPVYYFSRGMKKYCGKKLRILIIDKNIDGEYYFCLNDGSSWRFTSDMFEKSTLLIFITRRQECMK